MNFFARHDIKPIRYTHKNYFHDVEIYFLDVKIYYLDEKIVFLCSAVRFLCAHGQLSLRARKPFIYWQPGGKTTVQSENPFA